MPSNGTIKQNGTDSNLRVSGYVGTPKEKAYWGQELERVKREECLSKVSMGLLLSRIAQFGLKLDLPSLRGTVQEPAELTHKPVRRVRGAA